MNKPVQTNELEWKMFVSQKDGSVTWWAEIAEDKAIISGHPEKPRNWQAFIQGDEQAYKRKLTFAQADLFIKKQLERIANDSSDTAKQK